MNNLRLVIHLDQYAGNVEEQVCAALTGCGENRYGYEDGEKLYNEKVMPLLKDGMLPIELFSFPTEYGDMVYSLDTNTNALRIGIDFPDYQDLLDTIELWHKAYDEDGVITLRIPERELTATYKRKALVIKVLGFELVEIVENRSVVEARVEPNAA